MRRRNRFRLAAGHEGSTAGAVCRPCASQAARARATAMPGDRRFPAQAVEQLAQDGGADQAAEEVAGEIDAAGRAAVGGGGAADEAGGGRLGEEGADTDQRQPEQHGRQARASAAAAGRRRRRPATAQKVGRVPKRADDAAGERRGDDRRQEDEIDQAQRHRADRERRADQDEVDVGEGADEGEQDQEADREAAAQRPVAQMVGPGRERRAMPARRPSSPACGRAVNQTRTAPARLSAANR